VQIHTMEASISNELLEGEQLLWSGRPDSQVKSFVSPAGVFFIMGLVFLLVGLVGNFPARNTLYAITDHRVIILRTGRVHRVSSYRKRAITRLNRFERSDGSGDLVFSGEASPYGYGAYGNSEYNYNYYNSNRLGVFTAIPNVRQVEQKLLRMLDEGN